MVFFNIEVNRTCDMEIIITEYCFKSKTINGVFDWV